MTLSSRPIPCSRDNPCPVCDKIDGACRILPDDTVFCHGLADAKKFEKVNGYTCIKASTGHTATFRPDTSAEWTEERRREWEERKVTRQQAAEEEAKISQQRALPASDRHRLYSEILDRLSIDTAIVVDLQRRGFSPQEIERSGFKSVKKWQPLDKKYDTRLPGISADGKSLVVGNNGYLCPLRDFEGKITGVQLRLHDAQDGGRYRWLSTPKNATLKLQPEDETPLAVFHPPSGKPEGIAIVEGTGCKPFFVSQRLNLLTIGAAGGQWLSSPKLLEKYVKAAIEKYGDLPIKTIPDAGWALNSQVKEQLANLFDWLKDKFSKSTVLVLDWNQIHKSQGDVDELDDLSIIRELKLESFRKKYREVFGEKQGFASKRYQKWAEDRVKLTADILQHEKWLTISDGIQNECDILLIRKSLGAGKTQALIDFLLKILLQKPDVISLLVGYRNTLLNNTITRANDMGLYSCHVKDMVEKMQGYYVNFAADDTIKLWGGCADSFSKFNAIINRNPDYYLIHDEICSVLGHLKGGGTLKGRQQQAIEWDVNAIKNSKFSIMMDANLNDRTVEFIRTLYPEKRIKVLDSTSPVNPRTFYFIESESGSNDYTMSPKYLPSQLVEKAKASNKVLWISDSQRSCEVADEILTKHGHKHFRLDGKTSHEELSKHLQNSPKEFILTENLDSLSLSPSAESGLSIDLYDYFDAVCFDIRGTVGVNTLTQMSARLRDTNVPIYVACPEFVNMTADPCPYAIKNVEQVISQRIDILLSDAMETDSELINSEFVSNMFSEMAQRFAKDPWFIESLKDAKELKYEHQNLKLTLKTALAQAGNKIVDLVETVSENDHEEVQATKEFVKRREAEKIFNSLDIDYQKAQELDKQDVNYDIKCQIKKARLKHQLPGIEETPSWNIDFIYTALLDQPDFLNKRWRLKRFQSEELSKAAFKVERKYNFEFGFEAKDIWKAPSTKLKALKMLGVDKIIDTGTFSSQDAWVQGVVNQYYEDSTWFNLLGITKAKRSPGENGGFKDLRYINKMVERFVDVFGFELKLHAKTESNRQYLISTPENYKDFLEDIDDCLQRRATALIEEMSEVSLSAIACEAEKAKAAEEANQVELNKRMLEVQLTHTDSEKLALFPSLSIYPSEIAPGIMNQGQEWNKPEVIQDMCNLLHLCQTVDELSDLRRYTEAPAWVFKQAASQLSATKRQQIRQWVLQDNEARSMPND